MNRPDAPKPVPPQVPNEGQSNGAKPGPQAAVPVDTEGLGRPPQPSPSRPPTSVYEANFPHAGDYKATTKGGAAATKPDAPAEPSQAPGRTPPPAAETKTAGPQPTTEAKFSEPGSESRPAEPPSPFASSVVTILGGAKPVETDWGEIKETEVTHNGFKAQLKAAGTNRPDGVESLTVTFENRTTGQAGIVQLRASQNDAGAKAQIVDATNPQGRPMNIADMDDLGNRLQAAHDAKTNPPQANQHPSGTERTSNLPPTAGSKNGYRTPRPTSPPAADSPRQPSQANGFPRAETRPPVPPHRHPNHDNGDAPTPGKELTSSRRPDEGHWVRTEIGKEKADRKTTNSRSRPKSAADEAAKYYFKKSASLGKMTGEVATKGILGFLFGIKQAVFPHVEVVFQRAIRGSSSGKTLYEAKVRTTNGALKEIKVWVKSSDATVQQAVNRQYLKNAIFR